MQITNTDCVYVGGYWTTRGLVS